MQINVNCLSITRLGAVSRGTFTENEPLPKPLTSFDCGKKEMPNFSTDIKTSNLSTADGGQRYAFRTPQAAYELADFLAKSCMNHPLITLGLKELLLNAVEHGNLEIGFEEKSHLINTNTYLEELNSRLKKQLYAAREVVLEVTKKGKEFTFTIVDQGQGFDPAPFLNMASRPIKLTHGRGIALANEVCFEHLTYRGRGSIVECKAMSCNSL